jgi:small subunit ribosomal protein S2
VPTVSMKDLLQSGVHFGHQTRRWNPKMKSYIFSERGGIYIIDLQKTTVLIDEAYNFLRNVATRGGSVLFVGTKKQCQESIKEEAAAAGQPYVAARWLGGLLTNYATLSKRIRRLHELRELVAAGSIDVLPTRDQMKLRGELAKLETNLGGVAGMESLPSAVFVVDPRKEAIVIKEARKLHIPIVALVDTNCDPDEVDFVIPGNDDAIRSCAVIVKAMARAVADGRAQVTLAEFKAAEEKAAAAKTAAAAEAALANAAAAEVAAKAVVAEALASEAVVEAAVSEAAAEVTAKAAAKKDVAPAAAAETVAEAVEAKVVAEATVTKAVAADKAAAKAVDKAAVVERAAEKAAAKAMKGEVKAEAAAVEAVVAEVAVDKVAAAEPEKKTHKPAARKPAKTEKTDKQAAPGKSAAEDTGKAAAKDGSEA